MRNNASGIEQRVRKGFVLEKCLERKLDLYTDSDDSNIFQHLNSLEIKEKDISWTLSNQ